VPQQLQTLPLLKTKVKRESGLRSVNLTSSPHRGKAFIYGIEWGFRLDKANHYAARGVYIGLTHDSVIKRFYTHMLEAQKLKVYYDTAAQSTGVVGSAGGAADKQAKLLYIAMATSSWKNKKYIYPGFAYRAITPIAEPNLFDLAYQEIKMIRDNNAETSISTQFRTYRGLVEQAASSRGKVIGMNNSAGGESNALNSPKIHKVSLRDVVMAAFHFIREGRGSISHPDSLRNTIGIEGPKRNSKSVSPEISGLPNGTADLADDINKVFKYFKNQATGFEKLNAQTPTHNRAKKQMSELDKHCLSLGIGYSNYGKLKIPEDEKNLNLLISIKNQPYTDLTEEQINQAIDDAKRGPDASTRLSLRFLSNTKLKDLKDVANAVASHEFFQSGLGRTIGIIKLQSILNKGKDEKDPTRISLQFYIDLAKKDLKLAYDKLMRDYGTMIEKNTGFKNKRNRQEYIDKYNKLIK
jgi:hypothetical protein